MIDIEKIIDRTQDNLLESINNVLWYTTKKVNELKAERPSNSEYYEGYVMGLERARKVILEYKQSLNAEEEQN